MNVNLPFIEYIHLISTSMMVAIIWIVQILHYPTFKFIDRKKYEDFQDFHMGFNRTIVFESSLLSVKRVR